MAYDITAAGGASTKTIAADVYGAAHNVSSGEQTNFVALASGSLGALALATAANPIPTSTNPFATVSANFTRPADTTAYASGDLVANSTVAGSVTPMSFATAARYSTGSGQLLGVRLKKSTNTTTNASFRLHLYAASPTCTNGDNGVWLTSQSSYIGSIDLDASGSNGRVFSDPAAEVVAGPAVILPVIYTATATTIYGLIESRAAYSPGNAEVFTVELLVSNP
jgi:hypothetical protein